jgi:hypothetical protein|tara:strand:- start:223 stop:453 length:231 start_codon:yes stop_codon:yes gene_type:complete
MKEQTLIEMKNRIETLGMINQKLISEVSQTATIALGTLETLKHMPGYDEAISKLKDQAAEQSSKAEEADALGKDSN